MRNLPSPGARLVGLFALGALVFNFPLITLWDRGVSVLGLPLMALALFALWAGLIAAAAVLVERDDDQAASDAPGPSDGSP
ncbi:MAG TPA: hypothetical protein VFQ16_13520 [Burkholderiaceae bacterium]|nr:hypothetical protein [Burkholderiaceae bacterium]